MAKFRPSQDMPINTTNHMHRFPHGMAGKLAQNLLKIQLFPEVHSTG